MADSRLKLHWQAKLRSIDSCQNGTCADHYQKTNNVGSGSLRYTIWHFPLHAGRICLNHTRGLLIRILAILMKVNGGGVMNSSIAPIGIARRMILAIVTSREVYPGNFKWFHRASNVRSKCFLYRIWAIIFKGFERISCLSQTYQNVNKAY